ncbi:Chain B, Integrin Beta3-Talin Chimera [Pitangus sulphuratus]|nr:Chain B, Integrin Beta3-Talin Chimera [Pitangus sulphuratus]
MQARDDILNGSHPVSFDKACKFAGYQCPIQFRTHSEQKYKQGFLEFKDFLPKEHIEQTGEYKTFMVHVGVGVGVKTWTSCSSLPKVDTFLVRVVAWQSHKNWGNMRKIEAKVRYVKLAHSLNTYGVSFFLVKEKKKGKNKLVPWLLGITKECMMHVDEKTEELIQEWNLTNIKHWAPSPKSFTLTKVQGALTSTINSSMQAVHAT